MNLEFELKIDGIYQLKVPFMSVYTSVFLIDAMGEWILVDTATTADDVDGIIIPAIKKLGVDPCEIKKVVITHDHSDHAGGLERLRHYAPNIETIRTAGEIASTITAYPLPGHTRDFIGVFDNRTGTLISGDGLQGAGVDKYRAYAESREAYYETLERVRADGRIKNLVFSHAYEPWFKDSIFGRESVLGALIECEKYI